MVKYSVVAVTERSLSLWALEQYVIWLRVSFLPSWAMTDFTEIFCALCTSLVAQTVKRLPAMWETWVWYLGREDLLEKEMATHSSTLAWKIQWTEERGRLQSMGSQRVRHSWATSLSLSSCVYKTLLDIIKRKLEQGPYFPGYCGPTEPKRYSLITGI